MWVTSSYKLFFHLFLICKLLKIEKNLKEATIDSVKNPLIWCVLYNTFIINPLFYGYNKTYILTKKQLQIHDKLDTSNSRSKKNKNIHFKHTAKLKLTFLDIKLRHIQLTTNTNTKFCSIYYHIVHFAKSKHYIQKSNKSLS